MSRELVLYARAGCHLCEDMLAELDPLAQRFDLSISVIDVDADAQLKARYGDSIPVLLEGSTELSRVRLDARRLVEHLKKTST